MQIKRFIGGELESNGYVIYQREGGECYILDPGYNAGVFSRFITEKRLTLSGILLTHHHYDHTGAVAKLQKQYDCPVFMHRQDMDSYRGSVDRPLFGGEVIRLEDEEIRVIHTPGHTAGSVCFYSEKSKLVFTGDTIFDVDLGRTDLAGGSEEDMARTCREIIDKWSNEIYLYPGHDNGCSMKAVRRNNREFLDYLEG